MIMGYKDIDLFLLLFFNEVPFTIYTLMPEIKMALKWGQFQTDETHMLHNYFSTCLQEGGADPVTERMTWTPSFLL